MENTAGAAAGTAATQGQPAATQAAPEKAFSQAELDAAVSRAIATREANIKKEFESKKAAELGEFKQLYEQERAERARLELGLQTQQLAAKSGAAWAAEIFENDLTSIDGRKAAIKAMKAAIDAGIQAGIAERLKVDNPPAARPGEPKKPHQMSAEEYAAYRRANGIL